MMATPPGPIVAISCARRRPSSVSSAALGAGMVSVGGDDLMKRRPRNGSAVVARMQFHVDQLRADADVFDQFGIGSLFNLDVALRIERAPG